MKYQNRTLRLQTQIYAYVSVWVCVRKQAADKRSSEHHLDVCLCIRTVNSLDGSIIKMKCLE